MAGDTAEFKPDTSRMQVESVTIVCSVPIPKIRCIVVRVHLQE
jgi:hypothetical protein